MPLILELPKKLLFDFLPPAVPGDLLVEIVAYSNYYTLAPSSVLLVG